MKTGLLLLEMQNDYLAHGRRPLERSNDVIVNAQTVLQSFRSRQQPIIHVQHIATQPDATFLLPCTKGAEFCTATQPAQGEIIIKKHYPNSFKDTALLNHLTKQNIRHLVICGMTTHLTIDATVRAAYDLGFSCTVLHDTCAARQLEFNHTIISAQNVHYAFLAALQPTYAAVLTSEDFLQKIGAKIPVEAIA